MTSVKKLMSADVLTVKKEEKIGEAIKLLAGNKNGCLVVVDKGKHIGIVTDYDVVNRFAFKEKNLREPVSRIMSSPVTSMSPDMSLEEALKIVDTKRFKRYPVMRGEKLLGVVTKKDVVNVANENMQLHRSIQNFILVAFILFEIFVFLHFGFYQKIIALWS